MKLVAALGAMYVAVVAPAEAFSQTDDRIYYGTRAGMHLTTVSKQGIGSANAQILLEHTPRDAKAFCVEYVQDNSMACVKRTLAQVKVRDRVSGDCSKRNWIDMYGNRYSFHGAARKSSSWDPEYVLKRADTGEVLDGSSASGYGTQLTIFQRLCPGIAK